ncbi:hypothetical protein VTJ04DRAFT_10282 [Mycothermus thermophilus]|uniref:uncharacterized protein n=1 Tax=Humicola insolens TaxID=85995 RepID=UPI0037420826
MKTAATVTLALLATATGVLALPSHRPSTGAAIPRDPNAAAAVPATVLDVNSDIAPRGANETRPQRDRPAGSDNLIGTLPVSSSP